MAGPLLCADAPHLLYRAFFGLPDSIKGADDRPVNALLGSVNQTLWCVERFKPRAVVMCFGAEAAIYRTDAYPAYHAHRPEMPGDLAHQWALAPDLYRALGWAVVDSAELEADDLMGTLVADEEDRGGQAREHGRAQLAEDPRRHLRVESRRSVRHRPCCGDEVLG